jgi:hypothetical protein
VRRLRAAVAGMGRGMSENGTNSEQSRRDSEKPAARNKPASWRTAYRCRTRPNPDEMVTEPMHELCMDRGIVY